MTVNLPTVAEYARMSWHARQRLAWNSGLTTRKPRPVDPTPWEVRNAAQQLLDTYVPEDPDMVTERQHTLHNDYQPSHKRSK